MEYVVRAKGPALGPVRSFSADRRRREKRNKIEREESIQQNETGSRSPCMQPRSDPPNFGPIERGEKQTNNID